MDLRILTKKINFTLMKCTSLLISGHGFLKMAERYITVEEIEYVIKEGEVIQSYKDDKPYPSFLLLGFINNKPVHIVVAKNEEDESCILITAYIPEAGIWDDLFKTKKS